MSKSLSAISIAFSLIAMACGAGVQQAEPMAIAQISGDQPLGNLWVEASEDPVLHEVKVDPRHERERFDLWMEPDNASAALRGPEPTRDPARVSDMLQLMTPSHPLVISGQTEPRF